MFFIHLIPSRCDWLLFCFVLKKNSIRLFKHIICINYYGRMLYMTSTSHSMHAHKSKCLKYYRHIMIVKFYVEALIFYNLCGLFKPWAMCFHLRRCDFFRSFRWVFFSLLHPNIYIYILMAFIRYFPIYVSRQTKQISLPTIPDLVPLNLALKSWVSILSLWLFFSK